MTEFGFEREESTNKIELVAEKLTRQLGKHAFTSNLQHLKAAEVKEYNPLNFMEAALNDEIVGQPEAVETVVGALRREAIRNPDRPIANLLFLGPTGVGKSEMGKELARQLHGDSGGFLRIDCSNYSQPHTVSALLGAPPSYVGREQKPVFASPELKKNRCVVMFDEIEKGSGKLSELLLQIMDEGELTLNGTGEKVSFKNAIIILTSNVGSKETTKKDFGFMGDSTEEVQKTKVTSIANNAMTSQFRPEIIGRLDSTIVFNKLTDEQFGEILDRHVDRANDRYKNLGVNLTLTPELRDQIVASSEERHKFGARPVLRQYEKLVETLLADHISTGGITKGNRVFAVMPDDQEDVTVPGGIELYYLKDKSLIPKPKPLAIPEEPDLFIEATNTVEEPKEPEMQKFEASSQVLTIGAKAAALAIASSGYFLALALNMRNSGNKI